MAREFSPRPLTPGVITIWYRAPEVLLGTKYYTQSVDMWSAGLILAELLLSTPCLTGETPIEQLSLIVKLLGSPSSHDIAAFTTMGCPELVRWRRESLSSGRVDNIERRFSPATSAETVNFLRGLLKWDPHARWTPLEALGHCRGSNAADAERWWKESPRAIEKELLPTYPEVRNGIAIGGNKGELTLRSAKEDMSAAGMHHGYVFDFDGPGTAAKRPVKRPRVI